MYSYLSKVKDNAQYVIMRVDSTNCNQDAFSKATRAFPASKHKKYVCSNSLIDFLFRHTLYICKHSFIFLFCWKDIYLCKSNEIITTTDVYVYTESCYPRCHFERAKTWRKIKYFLYKNSFLKEMKHLNKLYTFAPYTILYTSLYEKVRLQFHR